MVNGFTPPGPWRRNRGARACQLVSFSPARRSPLPEATNKAQLQTNNRIRCRLAPRIPLGESLSGSGPDGRTARPNSARTLQAAGTSGTFAQRAPRVQMSTFLEVEPTIDNHWRALVLFGRNVATYKFALGRALLGLRDRDDDLVSLEELALPYARAICEHLQTAPKQATSASSRFLDACRAFNAGETTEEALRGVTVQLGFNNVIDAFHRLGPGDLERRFFIDERSQSKAIRLTDHLRQLGAERSAESLVDENEARWRLVETAWEMGVNRALIAYEPHSATLSTALRGRRVNVTSCRSALNGYQKGRCFYCFDAISIEPGDDLADVDHVIPWALKPTLGVNLDGVWNLALACQTCNRGQGGKFDFVPELDLVERLHRRNEFLIGSHHPLRETLMAQTGETSQARSGFLSGVYRTAVEARVAKWRAPLRAAPAF